MEERLIYALFVQVYEKEAISDYAYKEFWKGKN